MTRVLLVSQPTDGGVFRHVRDLAEGLPALGFDVALAAPPLTAPAPADTVITLPLVRAPSPTSDARALAGLVRAVRAYRPDIVHAHSSKAGAVARLARVLTPGTPVVYTPHGYAHAGYFESRGAATGLRPGRARADAAHVTHRLRLRGRATACARPRRGPRARLVYNGIDAPADGPVHPRGRRPARARAGHRDRDAAAARQGDRDAARRDAGGAGRAPRCAARDRRRGRRP